MRRVGFFVCALAIGATSCATDGDQTVTTAVSATPGTTIGVITAPAPVTTAEPATTSASTVTTVSINDLSTYSLLGGEIEALLSADGELVDALCPRERMPSGIPGAIGFVPADDQHPAVLGDARADRPSSDDPAETLAFGDATRVSPLIERYSLDPEWLAPTLGDLQLVICVTGADVKGSFIQECPYSGNNTVVWYTGVASVVAFDAASGIPAATAIASSSESAFPCNLIAAFDGQGETKESVRSSHDVLARAIEALLQPTVDAPEGVTIEWLVP